MCILILTLFYETWCLNLETDEWNLTYKYIYIYLDSLNILSLLDKHSNRYLVSSCIALSPQWGIDGVVWRGQTLAAKEKTVSMAPIYLFLPRSIQTRETTDHKIPVWVPINFFLSLKVKCKCYIFALLKVMLSFCYKNEHRVVQRQALATRELSVSIKVFKFPLYSEN